MKKLLAALCLLPACFLSARAPAEELLPSPEAFGGAQILQTGEICSLDLDGDGVEEEVQLRMSTVEGEESLQLAVETDELIYEYNTYIYYGESARVTDLDGDGKSEVLLSGDEASADYVTYCLRFDPEKGLQPVPFSAAADRGGDGRGYADCGYGRLDAIEGDRLTLSGSQDFLGTWWCERTFALRDGRFELADDGIWHVVEDFDDPEIWEFKALPLIRELDVTLDDGSSATLSAGDSLVITESDRQTYVGFLTRDGRRGTFPVEPDVENGWGFTIDGLSEYDYFDFVPYAD